MKTTFWTTPSFICVTKQLSDVLNREKQQQDNQNNSMEFSSALQHPHHFVPSGRSTSENKRYSFPVANIRPIS
jgi:hypothetical protein